MTEVRSPMQAPGPSRRRSARVPEAEVLLDARNPFPGPKPYLREQKELFFGRGHEIEELTSLVLSTSAVLLYAQSGSGKSSLLHAGLVPSLDGFGYRILPTVRFGRVDPEPPDGGGDTPPPNPFAKLVSDTIVAEGILPQGGPDLGQLADRLGEIDGGAGTVLILDQLEELFASQALWRERGEFLAQLRRTLDGNPWLCAVLAIRSDYLADLLPYERELPGRMLIRYGLESLREQAARDAIEKTFQSTDVPLASTELDSVLDRLLSLEIGPPGSHFKGQYVNLIQLQILCRRLWWEKSELGPRGDAVPSDGSRVLQDSEVDLADYMQSFVDDAVAAVVTQTQTDEGIVRLWLEDRLTTSTGRRAVLLVDNEKTAGLPQPVLEALEDARLIQVEQRNQSRWAELTHDSMVAAIRTSNAGWIRVRRRTRRWITAALAVVLVATLISFALLRVPADPTLLMRTSGTEFGSSKTIPFSPAPTDQVTALRISLSGQSGPGAVVRVVARNQGKDQDKDKDLARSAIPTSADGDVDTTVNFAIGTVPSTSYAVIVDTPNSPADSQGNTFLDYYLVVRSAPVILNVWKPGAFSSAYTNSPLVAVRLYRNKPLYLGVQFQKLLDVLDARTLMSNDSGQQVVIEPTGGDGYAVLSLDGEGEAYVTGRLAAQGPYLELGTQVRIRASDASVSSVHVEAANVPFAVEASCPSDSSLSLLNSTMHSAGSRTQSVPDSAVLVSAAKGSEYGLILLTRSVESGPLDCTVSVRSFAQQRITTMGSRKVTIDANRHFNAYLVRLPTDAAVIATNLNGAHASLDCLSGTISESNSKRLLAFAPASRDCVLSVARSSGGTRQPVSFPLLIVPVSGR